MSSEEVISKSKLKKLAKKSGRKKIKTKELLKKSGNINLSHNPTKHLLVSNGGLGNSVSRDDIIVLFRPHGLLEAVVMQEQMPHSFVTYADVACAREALRVVNGHRLVRGEPCEQVITLYVSYVDKVPEMAPMPDRSPEGLHLIHDFIDEETEAELQELIRWNNTDSQSSLKHRRVKHYGYEFNYDTNNVDKDRPLPEPMPGLLTNIIERIMDTGHVTCRPDQVTVNQYLPGQGIPPHVDTHSAFEDAIVSLSIGSMVSMDFTHPDGTHMAKVLPARSLLMMTGEARYLWNHGITPRKNDIIPDTMSEVGDGGMTLAPRGVRTSFTFRAVRRRACTCDFPERCDSQQRTESCSSAQEKCCSSDPEVKKPSSEAEAVELERSQVHKVYNEIAPHFSDTRYKPWPQVASFLNGLEKGSIVLDVGCGNGKYISVNPDIHVMGCDRSSELISICAGRGHEVFVCDGLDVSMKSGTFDACISIAVIHHFSTPGRRLEAVKELARLLRPGGLALVYVWAMEQKKHNQRSKYLQKGGHHTMGANGGPVTEVRVDGAARRGELHGSDADSTAESSGRVTDDRTKKSAGNTDCGALESEGDTECRTDRSGGDTDCRAKESERGTDLSKIMEQMSLCKEVQQDGCQIRHATEKGVECLGGFHGGNVIQERNGSDEIMGRADDSGRCIVGTSENSADTVLHPGGGTVTPSSSVPFPTGTEQGPIQGSVGDEYSVMTGNGKKGDIGSGATSVHDMESLGECVKPSEDRSMDGTSHLTVHVNKTEFKEQDLLVPWHLKSTQKRGSPGQGGVFYRFYHVFQEGELEELVRGVGGVSIERSYYDQGNWCVIFRKSS